MDGRGSVGAAGESSAANDEKLQDAMFCFARASAGGFTLEIAVEQFFGIAIRKQQVLDDVLRAPGSSLSAKWARGTKLAGVAVPATEGFAVTEMEVFEYGMHGGVNSRPGASKRRSAGRSADAITITRAASMMLRDGRARAGGLPSGCGESQRICDGLA